MKKLETIKQYEERMKNEEMEKKIDYSLPMWVCVGCIAIMIAIWLFSNGIFSSISEKTEEIKSKDCCSCEEIEETLKLIEKTKQ